MPLYEYRCEDCNRQFEMLRPFSQSDSTVPCPDCAGANARRMISRFAAVSRDSGGGSRLVASSHGGGGGGCGGCSGGSCSTCGH